MKHPQHLAIGALSLAMWLAAPFAAQASVQVASTLENVRVDIVNNKGIQAFLPVTATTGKAPWHPELGLGHGLMDDAALIVVKGPAFGGTLPTEASVSAQTPFGLLSGSATSTAEGLNFEGHFGSATPTSTPPASGLDTVSSHITASIFPQALWDTYAAGDPSVLLGQPVHGGLWLPAFSTATISGTMGLEAAARVDDLLVDPARVQLNVAASTVVGVFHIADGGTFEEIFSDPLNEQRESIDWSAFAFPEVDADLTPIDEKKSFSLQIQNASDKGQWLILGASMTVDLTQTILADNSPVPEPGTWALMALGLAGIGAAKARATPRQRARI